MPEWKSVDVPPERGRYYLVVDGRRWMHVAHLYSEMHGQLWIDTNECALSGVTHYQELPEAPA